jgi:hypothetical protein
MNNSIKQVLAEEQIKLQDICETINACKISKERRLPNLFRLTPIGMSRKK